MPASGTPWLRINRVLRLMLHTRWGVVHDGAAGLRPPVCSGDHSPRPGGRISCRSSRGLPRGPRSEEIATRGGALQASGVNALEATTISRAHLS